MPGRKSQEEFIEEVKTVWGEDAFDLSQVHYINRRTPVEVKCKTCGETFYPQPGNLLSGHGCSNCAGCMKMTLDLFIRKANKVHGNKYTYSKAVWKGNKTEVVITCPVHGDFVQIPKNHLHGNGCKECAKLTMGSERLSLERFLEKAKEAHGARYDYSLIKKIKNNRQKLPIICKKHGVFMQSAHAHLDAKSGCPYCKHPSLPVPLEDFIRRAREKHGEKYDYSKVSYEKLTNKVIITCRDCGYQFLQSAANHLRGAGCPHCCQSKGERTVRLALERMGVTFREQEPFYSPIAPNKKHVFKVDFYVPEKRLIIEYNGQYHYRGPYINHEGRLKDHPGRDKALRVFCEEEHYNLLEIPYWDFDRIEEILEKELQEL